GPPREDPLGKAVRLLKSADLEERIQAAQALGALAANAEPAIPELVKALDDRSTFVRAEVVRALEKVGPAAVPALAEALGNSSENVRISAARALSGMGAAAVPVVPKLGRVLRHDKSRFVRWEAAATLGELGRVAQAALPALEAALHDKDG